MSRTPEQRGANVNIGGQEIHVDISVKQPTAGGPIHLAGDAHLKKHARTARPSVETDAMARSREGLANFASPAQNIQKLGFREGMRVADFGAGSGAYALALLDLVGNSGVVYAVDVQRDLLTRIQNEASHRKKENIEIIWGDIEEVDGVAIRDELLDGVLISNTLFQVENKIQVIKEAWRVLKKGGVLTVIEWSDSYAGLGPQKNEVVSQAEVTLLCSDNNFAFKGEFSAGEHHYGLTFIKVGKGEQQEDVLAQSVSNEEAFMRNTIAQELV